MIRVKIHFLALCGMLMLGGCATTCETDPALQTTSERIFCGHKDDDVLADLQKKLNELDQRALKIEQQIEEYNATLFLVGKKRDSLQLNEDQLAQLNQEIASLKDATRDLETLNQQTQSQIGMKKQQSQDSEIAATVLQTEVTILEGEVNAVESQVDSVNDAFKRSLAMSLLRDN